jgi:hypothetical protein
LPDPAAARPTSGSELATTTARAAGATTLRAARGWGAGGRAGVGASGPSPAALDARCAFYR